MWSILWKIYDFRYLGYISTEEDFIIIMYTFLKKKKKKKVARPILAMDVWSGHNVERMLLCFLCVRLEGSARFCVLFLSLFFLGQKKEKKENLRETRAIDLMKREIYPSHSGNFLMILWYIGGGRGIKRKREKERPQKKKKKRMSVPHYDRQTCNLDTSLVKERKSIIDY